MGICTFDTKGEWMVQRYNATTGKFIDASPVHLYIPAIETKVEHSNLTGSSTGWDEAGNMHIDWIRPDVVKVFLKWSAMTATELNNVETWLQGQNVKLWYKDKGQIKVMTGYCGESSYELYSSALMDEDVYTNVAMNVIQTFGMEPTA